MNILKSKGNGFKKKMKIISWNVNGIRSVLNKNLWYSFIYEQDPDIICLQETKAEKKQVQFENTFSDIYKHSFWSTPEYKKGYSGTAIFSKTKPLSIDTPDPLKEGRIVLFEFEKFYLINVYVPNSKSDLSRLNYRVNEWDVYLKHYILRLEKVKSVIVCGDFNSISQRTVDIHNEKINNVPGATLCEIESFNKYLEFLLDTFRLKYPTKIKYSWWSYMGQARKNNKGWRLDYFLATHNLLEYIEDSDILDQIPGSDHAPCMLLLTY